MEFKRGHNLLGFFITFEGIEGCGKSTHASSLVEKLKCEGYNVLHSREPGGTAIGKEIRHTLKTSPNNSAMTPEAELLLMNASRAQLVRESIRPALSRGEIVVCDRFYDSTIAYQGYGRGLNLDYVNRIIDFAVDGTDPDITFLLNSTYEQGQANIGKRKATLPFVRDRIEESDRAFFERVHNGYGNIAKENPKRFKVIPYMDNGIEAMQDQIRDYVMKYIEEFGLSNTLLRT